MVLGHPRCVLARESTAPAQGPPHGAAPGEAAQRKCCVTPTTLDHPSSPHITSEGAVDGPPVRAGLGRQVVRQQAGEG